MSKEIILASASPRRKELLNQIGVEFQVMTADVEEIYYSILPEDIVKELAVLKAKAVANSIAEEERAGKIIIGADTVVAMDGRILGKPQNWEHAMEMLSSLQGRSHQVFTGVSIISCGEEGAMSILNHAEETKVFVHKMSDQEIREYILSGEPMDKAGAYAIQGKFAAYIEKIEGDYYNVVGLPIAHVYQSLKKFR